MSIQWLMCQNDHQISIVKLANVSGFSKRSIYHLTKLTVGLPNLQQLADLPELQLVYHWETCNKSETQSGALVSDFKLTH